MIKVLRIKGNTLKSLNASNITTELYRIRVFSYSRKMFKPGRNDYMFVFGDIGHASIFMEEYAVPGTIDDYIMFDVICRNPIHPHFVGDGDGGLMKPPSGTYIVHELELVRPVWAFIDDVEYTPAESGPLTRTFTNVGTYSFERTSK